MDLKALSKKELDDHKRVRLCNHGDGPETMATLVYIIFWNNRPVYLNVLTTLSLSVFLWRIFGIIIKGFLIHSRYFLSSLQANKNDDINKSMHVTTSVINSCMCYQK